MARLEMVPIVVLLLATITVAQPSTESPSANKTLKCPRVGFQYFFKNLNQSVTYRVAMMQEKQAYQDITEGIANATISFVRTPHSAFLVLRCERPAGATCDVFTAWRDFDTGDLRVIRNELTLGDPKPELQYTFGIEKQGGVYFWCDPERRQRYRFQLVPIVAGQKEKDSGAVCSAEYGNFYNGTDKQCDLRYLQQTMIHNDLKATSGFNKRALLMSIVLLALILMTLIAIAMAQWMNKKERLVCPK